jgi:hypothetical protein
MRQQDTTDPVYESSGTNPNSVMSDCLDEKTHAYNSSYAGQPYDNIQRVCARENNLRLVNGEWVKR